MSAAPLNPSSQTQTVAIAAEPFQLGEWLIQPAFRCARMGDIVVKIEPRNLRVLQALASRPGEVVSARDIESLAWEGFVVTSDSLYQSIRQLRQLLGDTKSPATYIETVPRRGYKLVASVSRAEVHGSREAAAVTPRVGAHLGLSRGGSLKRGFRWLGLVAAAAFVVALSVLYGPDALRAFARSSNADVPADPRHLTNLGHAALMQGDARKSQEYLEAALQDQMKKTGERNEIVGNLYAQLGVVYMWLDDEHAARRVATKALSIFEQLAPNDRQRLETPCNVADTLIGIGDYAEAERLLGPINLEVTARYGKTHGLRRWPLQTTVDLRWAQGKLDEAQLLAREAVQLEIGTSGADTPSTAIARIGLGAILIDRGDWVEAEEELRLASDIIERTTIQSHPYRASVKHFLAEVLAKTGRPREAEELLRAELKELDAAGAVDWRIGRAMSALSESLILQGKVREGERYLSRAKQKLTRTKGWPIEREIRNLEARTQMLESMRVKVPSVSKL